MDAPTLDPCAQGGCLDVVEVGVETGEGSTTVDATQDALDAPADHHDASACLDVEIPDSGNGIRCGGGCFPVVFCTGSTPVCCQSTDDAGVTTFACTSSETTCDGYPIRCVNENDCGGSDVCCHFQSHMICDTACTNATELACIPGSPQDCPAGKACDVQVTAGGQPLPYFLCEP
jgi:hypothetical protein